MTKEQEIMIFLHENVFDPILDSDTASDKAKRGVRHTIACMSKLPAESMIKYFWSALLRENAIEFSDMLKKEGLPCFEDISGKFKTRFC